MNRTDAVEAINRVRYLARLHGWAIGVHGSLDRDIDLIAVPWVADASSMYALVSAMCLRLNLVTLDRRPEMDELRDKTRFRPFGRRTLLLAPPESVVVKVEYPPDDRFRHRTFWDPPALDISFIDPRLPPPPEVTP